MDIKFIPYAKHNIDEDEINEVIKVLKSSYLTQGPTISQFEEKFKNFIKAPFAIACSNGTAALHLSALSINVSSKDKFLVPAITFVASANCILYSGGRVGFCDIDLDSYTICVESAYNELQKAKNNNDPYTGIITVDLAGHPANYEKIALLVNDFKLKWIVDACHALGASWYNSSFKEHIKVGSWNKPNCYAFSFHPSKHITTAEGGMVITHAIETANKAKLLRTHGIEKYEQNFIIKDLAYNKHNQLNPWYYEAQELGYNYRLSDVHAAIGISQLNKIDHFIKRRQEIAQKYNKLFIQANLEELLITPKVCFNSKHSYHLYIIRIDFSKLKISKAEFMNILLNKNIGTQLHYIPIPLMPLYRRIIPNINCIYSIIPNSLKYYEQALSIPMFPSLTDEEIEYITKSIISLIKSNYCKKLL